MATHTVPLEKEELEDLRAIHDNGDCDESCVFCGNDGEEE